MTLTAWLFGAWTLVVFVGGMWAESRRRRGVAPLPSLSEVTAMTFGDAVVVDERTKPQPLDKE